MGYTLAIENEQGDTLTLTGNSNYSLTSITGLNPPESTINTAVNANFDGSIYKSSRMNNRNIVINLAIEQPVETNRIALYSFFKSKKSCTVYYTNKSRDVSILGYVESFQIGFFEQKETAQISVICPQPYFEDIESNYIVFTTDNAAFEFPFEIPEAGIEFSTLTLDAQNVITNTGDFETGLIIIFHAIGHVENPTIYNITTGALMKINIELEEGDIVTIDTTRGSKKITLNSDGTITNIFNDLDYTSSWLTLEVGDNIIMYTADEYPQYLICNILYTTKYEGV